MTKENSIGQEIISKETEQGFDRADQIFAAYREYKEKNPQSKLFLLDKKHHVEFFGKMKNMKSFSMEDDLLVVANRENEYQFDLLRSFGEKKDEFNIVDKYGNKFLIPFEKEIIGRFKSKTKINKRWTDYLELDSDKERDQIKDVNDLRNLLAKR